MGFLLLARGDSEELEKNDTAVKARRSPGVSEVWFESEVSIALLDLKPFSSLKCAYPYT